MPNDAIQQSVSPAESLVPVQVQQNVAEAAGLHRLVLAVDAHPVRATHAVAGQYVQVGLQGHEPRYYALASVPGAAEVELLVGRAEGLAATLCELPVGSTLWMSGAQGAGYPMGLLRGRQVVVMSSGTGLASVRPVIEGLVADGCAAMVGVYHSRPPEQAGVCAADFERWRVQGVRVEQTDGAGAGRYVQDLYAASEERAAALQTEFVVCGSPLMQRAVTDYLHGVGVTDAHIHFNY